MKVTNQLINKLAQLAKINFDPDAIKKMKSDLENILAFVNKLSEINTDDIEPLIYINEEVNTMRSDNIKCNITREESLKNAPKKDSDYFKVPTVLKK